MPPTAHKSLRSVLGSGQLAAGPKVRAFESQLAVWLAADDAVALSDASSALTLALYQAGVRPGDDVITSPLACAATIIPIANLFARPVWCDIDPLTGMPSTEHVATALTPQTRAILLYHWSGDVADIGGIAKLAKQHGLPLIEDASEAFGAEHCGTKLGGRADFTVYSFYATKHITTSEGAALLATDPDNAQKARHLRRFGIDPTKLRLPNGALNPDFDIALAGFNFQMNEIAATIGLAQLPHAASIVNRHRVNGQYFDVALAKTPGLRLLRRRQDSVSGFWTYALRAERRDDLIRKLNSRGIGAQRLHLRNDGYACFGEVRSTLPGVLEFDGEALSIPCGWWVDDVGRDLIAECINSGW